MDQGTEGSLGQLLMEGDFSCDGIPAGLLVEGGLVLLRVNGSRYG